MTHPFEEIGRFFIGQIPQLDDDGNEIGPISGVPPHEAMAEVASLMRKDRITEEMIAIIVHHTKCDRETAAQATEEIRNEFHVEL